MIKQFKSILYKKLPILEWLPQYNAQTAVADLVAGITVGLTLIPQSIAYAALANLSPQYGLYSSLSGGLVYMIFGTVPEINIAPTALLSLLTFNYTHELGPAFAVLLCFISGCVELLCGICNLGFLVEFVSVPVVAGFTSAAALIIASAQVKNMLGLKFQAEGFVDVWSNIFHKISQTKKWDATLSFTCCIILLTLRKLKDYATPITTQTDNPNGSLRKKIIWFISVARNAIVVLLCALMAFIFETKGMRPFSLTDKVEAGLPSISPPPFQTEFNNQTYTFPDMTLKLGSGIIVVPLVAILGNIAIAKAFANGKVVNASQEMFTLGICNLIGSFFSSMPVNGSFSRSAVNNASGVKTPFGGLYTGILVILSLSFLTPYFSYIPKPTLSSVIICAVIFMVEVSIVKPLWNTNRINLIPCFATFLACLFLGVELGILVGIAVDIVFMLYFNARPRMEIETVIVENGVDYLRIKPEGAMLFPAVEHVRRVLTKAGDKSKVIVIDCVYVTRVDFTAAQGIGEAVADLKKSDCDVVFIGLKPEIAAVLAGFCRDKCTFAQTDGDLTDIVISNSSRTAEKNGGASTEQNKKSKKKKSNLCNKKIKDTLHDVQMNVLNDNSSKDGSKLF